MQESKATIRSAQYSDLAAVHALVRELAIYERAEPEFTATLEDYQQAFSEGVFEALIAQVDGQTVGLALYYLTFSTWKGKMLYLEDFVVQSAFRRYGLGQRLFDALQERGRELGCRLMKWQILDWNEPALAFYRKNQAVIETEWWNGKLFL